MDDSRSALMETVRRIDRLTQDEGGLLEHVDIEALHRETGVERDTIVALLNGEDVPEDVPEVRVHKRFTALRETRLRPDGKIHSLAEIAAHYDMAPQSLTKLAQGRGTPSLPAAHGIQSFFKVHAGFLMDSNCAALNRALKPVLQNLAGEHSVSDLMNRHRVLEFAFRADRLTDDQQSAVLAVVDAMLTNEQSD